MPSVQPTCYYDTDDDDETLATAIDDLSSLILYPSNTDDVQSFQEEMEDRSDPRIFQCQNTYFMDGGVRFISLPTLGSSNTKTTLLISRVFEEWLANKLYNDETYSIAGRLPILEDNVELLAEDILNKFKTRSCLKSLKGIAKLLIKIRTGHVYTYHQLENGQPLITEDMEDFFQQFPLFVEIVIYALPLPLTNLTEVCLVVENSTMNPGQPYVLMESIQS
ncbi:hypothetical protein K501DRAFT_195295 [Backusella circina FSU 941]|nr:hypothetical protein K501DRAFT_195295 [Backusella circina FSU 941]